MMRRNLKAVSEFGWNV